MSCKPKILVEAENFSIAQCANCRRIGFHFKNILVGFEADAFLDFIKSYSKVDFDKNCTMLVGQEQIILKTCHTDIQFAFNRAEFDFVNQRLQQAKVILEANRILEL